MSASPQPVNAPRLDTRVNSEYDYTNADAVINTLSIIITCPSVQEVSSALLIFNEQFYNTYNFEHYLKNETRQRDQYLTSGYSRDLI